jgi:hypothetical protein
MSAPAVLPDFVRDDHQLEWQMTSPERAAIIQILNHARPPVAIEIGTHKGGSLQVISPRAGRVYSLDINPQVKANLSPLFKNVEFRTGDSAQILPKIFREIDARGEELGFVLIDGDHSREGVRRDTNLVLGYAPRRPVFVVFHDSFHPQCREGILAADWQQCPHAHYFNVDFVGGIMPVERGQTRVSMWGGFGLAVLLPQKRSGPLTVLQPYQDTFDFVYPRSRHYDEGEVVAPPPPPPSLLARLCGQAARFPRRVLKTLLRGKTST